MDHTLLLEPEDLAAGLLLLGLALLEASERNMEKEDLPHAPALL